VSDLHVNLLYRSEVYPGQLQHFRVLGLEAELTYEVLISYPATVPSEFEITFVNAVEHSGGRKLLNTEKLVFQTDSLANVLSGDQLIRTALLEGADATGVLLRVSVLAAGYSNVPNYDHRPTPYTIVIQPLSFGVLPPGALWLLLFLCSALLFTWLVIYPRVVHFIHDQQSEYLDKAA